MVSAQIPKVIHYCWFGRNPLPPSVRACIRSWKKYCPDYKIVEWNEDNFDIGSCDYMKEAYEAKKWAFVSDVARLMIIYRNGGIYLDTDVELIAPLEPIREKMTFSLVLSQKLLSPKIKQKQELIQDLASEHHQRIRSSKHF